jgi:hypothetical protein
VWVAWWLPTPPHFCRLRGGENIISQQWLSSRNETYWSVLKDLALATDGMASQSWRKVKGLVVNAPLGAHGVLVPSPWSSAP